MNFFGRYAVGGYCFPRAQPLQGANRIWAKLEARSYLIKYRGLFQNEGRFVDARQAQPCGKARNSTANYEKW